MASNVEAFPLTIGVAGPTRGIKSHRLAADVRSAFIRLAKDFAGSRPECLPRLISNLAPGVDQIAMCVAGELGWSTVALLPMPRLTYAHVLGHTATAEAKARQREFERLVADPTVCQEVEELQPLGDVEVESACESAYEAAARALVARVHLFVAVWGGPNAERAGHAEASLTIRAACWAAERGIPALWIPVGDVAGQESEPVLPVKWRSIFVGGRCYRAGDALLRDELRTRLQ